MDLGYWKIKDLKQNALDVCRIKAKHSIII